MLLSHFQITFFGCFKEKTFIFIHDDIESIFGNKSPETFPLVRFFVKKGQVFDAYHPDSGIGHGLCVIFAGGLSNKTFVRSNDLMLSEEEHVFVIARFVVGIIGSEIGTGSIGEFLSRSLLEKV